MPLTLPLLLLLLCAHCCCCCAPLLLLLLQVVNKAIAAELIFVATTNFDQVRGMMLLSVWVDGVGFPLVHKGGEQHSPSEC
jgi:hypothetical protein